MKNKTRLAKPVNQHLNTKDRLGLTYESYMSGQPRNEEGDAVECAQANPDVLAEGTGYWGDTEPTKAQMLMGEAVAHLQGRQREVYMLIMREGYSCSQAGAKLGISKWTARDYKDRAIKFISQYCQRNMKW